MSEGNADGIAGNSGELRQSVYVSLEDLLPKHGLQFLHLHIPNFALTSSSLNLLVLEELCRQIKIELHYAYPLSLLFTDSILTRYQSVHRFLL